MIGFNRNSLTHIFFTIAFITLSGPTKAQAQCKPLLRIHQNGKLPKLIANRADTVTFSASCIPGCRITVEAAKPDGTELAQIGTENIENNFVSVVYRILPRKSGSITINVTSDCPKGTVRIIGETTRDVSGKNLYVSTTLDIE
jgi:hypothetical protein